MKKTLGMLMGVLLVLVCMGASAQDYVSVTELYEQAQAMGGVWQESFDAPNGQVTVDAPIIRELPLALECRLVRFNEDGICIGDIVNVSVDESVLGADGVPDTDRLDAIVFDGIRNLYRHVGKAAAPAFEAGKKLI